MGVGKRTLDLCGAIIGLILSSPVLCAIAVWIRLDSKGPIFFIQQRLGKDGRPFAMYKFRTMVRCADRVRDDFRSYPNDSRVTFSGKYIRLASLDELPQLLNVARGEMSLVGPRPPVVQQFGDYEDFEAPFRRRFAVKPGITGLAQISGRNALSWSEKAEYDLRYIERYEKYGIVEDLRIILITFGVVLSMRNTVEQGQ